LVSDPRPSLHPNCGNFCDGYHARRSGVKASLAIVSALGAPAQSQEHVMRNWWIPAVCAGGGALIGVAVGDWYSVSHTVGMVLAGAGAGIGAVIGSVLAAKIS
jgi:hypothetical protein